VVLAELRRRFPAWARRLGEDHLLDLGVIASLGATAMTEDIEIAMTESGLPNTFVPGRNLLFFTAAAALAYRRGIRTLVGGMCETDFSGYPDCRDDTINTLQGEGMNAGRPAVFCRFAGCNLWSGREEDRAGAVCRFCDTDFAGTDGTNGGKYASAGALAGAIAREWPAGENARRFAVLTGG